MADVRVYNSPDINISEIARNFGLELSESEAQSLQGAFASTNNAASKAAGVSAIANYVNTKTAQMKAEADNPMKKFIEEEKIRRTEFEGKANQLYEQLQQTISAAPKLFGNLTPDQIQQYIAPITAAARSNSANLEGDFGRRGIVGSSIEAGALADADRKYKENVLNTGLNLGMQTQGAQAAALQQRINQLFGASGQSSNLMGGGAGQLTDQQFNNMNSITQLPLFLQAVNQQQALFNEQMKGPSFWDKFDRGLGTAGNVLDIGKKVVGIFKGGPGPTSPEAPPSGLI